MIKGEVFMINRSARSVIIPAVIAVTFFLLLSLSVSVKTISADEAGWYGITSGWNYSKSDVDGKVGHRLSVSAPRGRCEPENATWYADLKVDSGTLPPGLKFGKSDEITGIPTKRGHWIVNLRYQNLKCGDYYYNDYTQELRFHISGTGKVNY